VHRAQVAGGDDAEAAVETITLSDELKSLAAESLIQPGHDLTLLGTTAAGKELVVVGGEGAHLLTADGTKVLDGPGGIWNVQMGYGQMKIVDAVSEQMATLPFNSPFATIASPAATLAKTIADKAPADLNHVFFVTGGSEANDTALQFIYYRNNYMGRPNKKIILARERAYHGTTYMAHSLSMDTDNMDSMNSMGEGGGELVSRLSCPDPLGRPAGMTPEQFTDHLVEELKERITKLGSGASERGERRGRARAAYSVAVQRSELRPRRCAFFVLPAGSNLTVSSVWVCVLFCSVAQKTSLPSSRSR
jgi:putrescine aminotransferase